MVTTTKYMKKQPKKKTRKFAGGGFVNSFNDSFNKFKKNSSEPEKSKKSDTMEVTVPVTDNEE